jgi:hypothetical protein
MTCWRRTSPERPTECACEGAESAGCKSLSRFGLNLVTEGNCVAARRGGEQPEVNDRSVGHERDSACCRGEPAPSWRSPTDAPTHWNGDVLRMNAAARAVSLRGQPDQTRRTTRGGWRRNGQKILRIKQGDLLRKGRAYWPMASPARRSRSQSVHSSVEAG